jgi:hypothetical protein
VMSTRSMARRATVAPHFGHLPVFEDISALSFECKSNVTVVNKQNLGPSFATQYGL